MGKKKELPNEVSTERLKKGKPIEIITADELKRICGKDMNMAKHPTRMDFSDKLFQLRSIEEFPKIINTAAISVFDFSACRLSSVNELSEFANIKHLVLRNNNISSFNITKKLPKLEQLDLSRNQLSEIPDLSFMSNLRELDLGRNIILQVHGTNVFAPLSVAKKLTKIDLSANGIKMSEYDLFKNLEAIGRKKLPKLRNFAMAGNPVSDVNNYRIWLAFRLERAEIIDGIAVTKTEKKDKPPIPVEPSEEEQALERQEKGVPTTILEGEEKGKQEAGGEGKGEGEGEGGKGKDDDDGPMQLTNFVFDDLKALLAKCFDKPEESYAVIQQLEDYVKQILRLPPDLRYIEYNTPQPEDSIEEFLQSLSLMMQKLPKLVNIAVRILTRFIELIIDPDPIGLHCKEQVKRLLDAQGTYTEPIWLAIRDIVVPRLLRSDCTPELREHLLEVLYLVSTSPKSEVMQFLKPLVPIFGSSLRMEDPAIHALGLVAAAATDEETAVAIRLEGICDRVVELFEKEKKKPRSDKYRFIIKIVKSTAASDHKSLHLYVEKKVHVRLFVLINQMNFDPASRWPEDESDWAADVIAAADSLCSHDTALMAALQSDYVKRLLEIVDFLDVQGHLLATALTAVFHLLSGTTDSRLHDEVAAGLGYMVPCLDYVEGTGYEALCEQCGAKTEDGDSMPLSELKNAKVYEVLLAIVKVLEYFGIRASAKDPVAESVSHALDSAGRERYLFALLTVPDDDIRLATVHCLANVPLSNLQPDEVDDIVRLLNVRNVGIGRTEEVLAVVLQILETLVVDRGPEGEDFRARHGPAVKLVLKILEQNTMRDTGDDDAETEEKMILNNGCVNFLLAASTWPEGIVAMRSPDAVTITSHILQYEEAFGLADHPTWVEKTVLGSTVAGLFQYLSGLEMTGHIAPRVINRMAEVIEGVHGAPPSEDEENQDAKLWERQFVLPESDAEREFRYRQCEALMELDGITLLLDYLRGGKITLGTDGGANRKSTGGLAAVDGIGEEGDEAVDSGEPEDIDPLAFQPRDIISYVLSEQEKMEDDHAKKIAEAGALEEKEEGEDTLGMELEHEADMRHEEETDRRKRQILFQEIEDEFGDTMDDVEPPPPLGLLEPSSGTLVLPDVAHTPALAAVLRLFLAVLWYSDRETKEKTRIRMLEGNTLRGLAVLCRDCEWFSRNVGVRYMMVASELFRMIPEANTEPISSIPLYDIVSQAMEAMLLKCDDRLSEGSSLTPRQELAMNYIGTLWYEIMSLVAYINISNVSSDINRECHALVYTSLIPPNVLALIVRYLYYDRQVSTSPKFSEMELGSTANPTPHQITLRDVTRSNVTNCIAQYITVQDENRYGVLEVFNRLEVTEGIKLSPAYMQFLLNQAGFLAYHRALEKHLADRYVMPAPERILEHDWNEMIVPGEGSSADLRLVVFSNKAYYIMREPFGLKCSACPPEKFCPQGPVLKIRSLFDSICRVTIGFGGWRLLIEYQEKGLLSKKEAIVCMPDAMGTVGRMVRGLREVIPETVPIEDDHIMPGAFQMQLTDPGMEIILLHSPVVKVNIRAVKQPRIIVMTNTHIYNFKEDLSYWRGNDTTEKERKKMIRLQSKYMLRDLTKVEFNETESELSMRLEFKHESSSFYNLLFGDYMVRELWKRTLGQYVDPSIFVHGESDEDGDKKKKKKKKGKDKAKK